jgi:polysaccharide pyruvyl transferase WcaK-like protein
VEKHIYILSASDRFNYGDVLFPIVAKHELQKLGDYTFHNIATIKSDLSDCGAMPTQGYKVLLDYKNIPENSTLVVAGGEVLTANWSRLLSFTKDFYYRIYEKYEGERLEKFAKFLFGKNQLAYPFLPASKRLLSKFKLVFHAVGGGPTQNLKPQEEVKRAIESALYFSVREKETRQRIANNYSADVKLVPDSVMVLSDIYPKESLPASLKEDYVCVQFGYFKSSHMLPVILKELRKIHQSHKLKIGLLSIGNCPGHDDMKSAEWLKDKADFPVQILPCDSINEITSAIANAKLFIGTSLHGVIVSLSYGNPFVAVNKKIRKIESYSQAWAPEYLKGSVDFNHIAETANKRLATHKGYEELIKHQKDLVRQSFKRISLIADQ